MMEGKRLNITFNRMALGLISGAVVGLFFYICILFGAHFAVLKLVLHDDLLNWERQQFLIGAMFYFIFGLPIAILLGIAFGLPVWKRAERKGQRSHRDAVIGGTVVGASIGIFFCVVKVILGMSVFLDDNTTTEIGEYGYLTKVDGVLTMFGWLLELINILFVTLAGIVGALIARWVALVSFRWA